ncbi:MAG: hypothetical protein AAF602_11000 [Myxococcota bacterium]
MDPKEAFTLDDVFAPVPLYLTLLWARPGRRTREVVGLIRDAADHTPDLDDRIRQLVEDRNWRAVLVACGLLVMGHGRRPGIDDALWARLDPYHWAAPQLAGTLSVLDPDFDVHAATRLDCEDDPLSTKSALALRGRLPGHPHRARWQRRYGDGRPELGFVEGLAQDWVERVQAALEPGEPGPEG